MSIVMDKSIHKEHLSQLLQTKNKQFNIAVTFLTGYIGISNVTDKNIKFYMTVSINYDDFNVITIPKGAYEFESLNHEIKSLNIKEGYFTGKDTNL